MQYLKTYPNGLRLAVNEMPSMYSVSLGVCVGVGSTDETTQNSGISHFIEHMLFKGTKTRSAFDISDTIDGIGGHINAFTSKEMTCFYTKTMHDHAEIAAELLGDMLFNSVYDEEEMKKEKGVVLEEISMAEDTPSDVCQELVAKAFYGSNPLSMPILGSVKNVKAFKRDDILQYIEQNYNPKNMVISVAGKIKFEDAAKLVEKYFLNNFKNEDKTKSSLTPAHKPKSKFLFKGKSIEQANFCVAFPSQPYGSKYSYALMIANNIFGASMSSRLFQKIREEKGLAYSVYSYMSSYKDNGLYSIYAGANPQNIKETALTIKKEIDDIVKNGFTKAEFNRGKEQLKGMYVLSQESTSSIMNLLSKNALLLGELFDFDKKIEEINAVTLDQAVEAIKMTFDASAICAALVCDEKHKVDILEYLV